MTTQTSTTMSLSSILALTGSWPLDAIYATIELTLSAPYRWNKSSVRFFNNNTDFVAYYEQVEKQINAYAKDKNAPAARGIKAFQCLSDNASDTCEFSTHVLSDHRAWPEPIVTILQARDIKVEPKTDVELEIKEPNIKRGAPERKTHGCTLVQMESFVKQYNDGLISLPELLLNVQLTKHQVDALVAWNSLPGTFARAIEIPTIDTLADQYLNGDEKPVY